MPLKLSDLVQSGQMRGVSGEMHGYHAELPIAGSLLELQLTLKLESGGSNRIRYPGSPQVNDDYRCLRYFQVSAASESVKQSRLGSTPARLKLKGIDGGPHKRRNMWFNSMIREEPYQVERYGEIEVETSFSGNL